MRAVEALVSDMEAAAHNAEMLKPPAAEKRLRAAAALNDAELPAGKRQRRGSQIASTTTSGLPVHSTATTTTNPECCRSHHHHHHHCRRSRHHHNIGAPLSPHLPCCVTCSLL